MADGTIDRCCQLGRGRQWRGDGVRGGAGRSWPRDRRRHISGNLLGGVAAVGGIVAGVSGGGDSGGDAAPVNTPPSFTSGTWPASPKASPLPIRRWPPMRRTTRSPTAFGAPMRRCSTLTHRLARLRSRPRPISKTPPIRSQQCLRHRRHCE